MFTTPAKVDDFSWRFADIFGYLHSDFGRVARWILQHKDVMSDKVVDKIHHSIIRLFDLKHGILKSPENLAFTICLLGLQKTDETVALLANGYEYSDNPLVRSNIVHVFRIWGCADYLNGGYRNFGHLNPWERRAFVMAPETRKKLSAEKFTLLEHILINR